MYVAPGVFFVEGMTGEGVSVGGEAGNGPEVGVYGMTAGSTASSARGTPLQTNTPTARGIDRQTASEETFMIQTQRIRSHIQ